jgi:WD40 repeat protein
MPARADSLAFSPDGRTLASGMPAESTAGGESSVSLWDVATQELITATEVYVAGGVTSLDFTSDGTVLAAGHGHGDVRVLNVPDLSPSYEYDGPAGVFDVEFSPDDSVLATTSHEDDHLRLWSPGTETPEELAGHRGQAFDIAFSGDGSRFASAGADGRLILWRNGDDHALRSGGGPVHISDLLAISFAGDDIVTIGRAESADDVSLGAPEVGRRNVGTDTSDAAIPIPEGEFALSPDGRVAAIGDDRGVITQVDTETGATLAPPVSAHGGTVIALAFSADGRTLVSTGCREPTESSFCDGIQDVAVWNLSNGQMLRGWPIDSGASRLALSPDGRSLATTTGSPEVWLWDVAGGEPLFPEPLVAEDRTVDLAWSPDSRTLAVTGDAGGAHGPSASDQRNQNVILWDATTGNRIGEPLLGHNGGVTAAAFSPDGKLLASGDYTGAIRLWDVDTLAARGDRIAAGSPVRVLRFSPDGTTLASGHSDGGLRLWAMSPEAWIDRLCTAAGRELTKEEWAGFVGDDVEYEPTCPAAEP